MYEWASVNVILHRLDYILAGSEVDFDERRWLPSRDIHGPRTKKPVWLKNEHDVYLVEGTKYFKPTFLIDLDLLNPRVREAH